MIADLADGMQGLIHTFFTAVIERDLNQADASSYQRFAEVWDIFFPYAAANRDQFVDKNAVKCLHLFFLKFLMLLSI
jgi:hypothetical protein